MNFYSNIPAESYPFIFYNLVIILVISTALTKFLSVDNSILYARKNIPIALILFSVFLILFLGLRPIDSWIFGDTPYYKHSFLNVFLQYEAIDWNEEWIWHNFNFFCNSVLNLSAEDFILLIEFLSITSIAFVCWKFFPNNTWIAILFFVASFSFWGGAVNGIRNNLACCLVLVGLSLLLDKKNIIKLLSLLFFILALGIHRSTMLPILCALFAYFINKEPKYAMFIWFASIILSLIFNNLFAEMFAELGIDERLEDYLANAGNSKVMNQFSNSGFRFDFLLYSAMPLLFVWYLTIKRNFKDNIYNIIATTYILSNSFWILVIRASFSNRFAGLSWFLYPLVIVYPLLKMEIWDNQDKATAIILFCYGGFTYFMYLLTL